MYIPKLNRVTDIDQIHALMQQHSFATLVTSDDDGVPFATHMPVKLDSARGPHGTLISHIARANPQWRHFRADQEILIVFQGPHAYISPTWYRGDFNVPTWNYAAVHAYGIPRVVEDPTTLQTMLTDLITTYETPQPQPWSMDWTDARGHQLLKAIVGFELEITRLEGKVKMNQNKSAADQHGVIAALRDSPNENATAVATMMAQALTQTGEHDG